MDAPAADLRAGFGALLDLCVRLEDELADAVLGVVSAIGRSRAKLRRSPSMEY